MTSRTISRLSRLASPLILAAALALPAAAQTEAQGQALARALSEARNGQWANANAQAAAIGNQVAADVVAWVRLRDGVGSFSEYQSFLARNASWPGLALLRQRGESQIPAEASPAQVIAYFGQARPQTAAGALRLAEALAASGRRSEAEAEIVRAWREMSMTSTVRNAFQSRYGPLLAGHHTARLEMLLWRGLTDEASGMLPLVDAGWQALARARIGLRRDVNGTTALINAVPARLAGDPGLAYERYLWRIARGRWEEAEQFVAQQSASAAALGRPEMWMERRANLARQALRRGNVQQAYRIAAQNFGREGSDYADAEWVAGYIALTRMNDPRRAVQHFERFRTAVFTPISIGRAGYWLGLAHERAGNRAAAQQAYQLAAQHQTSFYGQLAAERAGVRTDGRLAGDSRAPDWRSAAFMRSSVVQAAYFLHLAGDDARMGQFLRHASERQPAEVRAGLAQMAIDLGRTHVGVRVAKDAASEGVVIPNQYYPLHSIANQRWPVPTEFAMAIARQESEFNPGAVSHAGARGLMQLMPGTAQQMARAVGTGYDAQKLSRDPAYNARLGTEYLSRMLNRYGGSYILAAAAYNAGPGRVDEWLGTIGDPRRQGVDPINWIESIPFTETRNYVMRVMEGLHVYRARLQGRAEPIRLVSDINRTG